MDGKNDKEQKKETKIEDICSGDKVECPSGKNLSIEGS